jgi:hypothetical protein
MATEAELLALSPDQREALLSMPFVSTGCGFRPSVLRSLRERDVPLADYVKTRFGRREWFPTNAGRRARAATMGCSDD